MSIVVHFRDWDVKFILKGHFNFLYDIRSDIVHKTKQTISEAPNSMPTA